MRFRTVWLSDLHLGNKDCKADFLIEFIRNVECETLYLLGDIIDLWSMKRRFIWPSSHYEIIKILLGKAQNGTTIIYIPGNHDLPLRDYIGQTLGSIEVRMDAAHTTADNKKLLLFHGDILDTYMQVSRFNRLIGDSAYDLLLFIHRWVDKCRTLLNLPYISLASQIKSRIPNAMQAIKMFEEAALYEATRRGFDGVICGHIHFPEIRNVKQKNRDILYCNTGDWVENCSALVEQSDGKIELLYWKNIAEQLAISPTNRNRSILEKIKKAA